jgi:AcrR family transcriptional regulator
MTRLDYDHGVSERPFHHGNLRAELLDRAEDVLRNGGIDALSLRELARLAGVSHGAPRSHFVDRNALLDALAERGFLRLIESIERAAASAGNDYPLVLRSTGAAFINFAVSEAALLELMFAAKVDDPSPAVHAAAGRMFEVMSGIVAQGVNAGRLVQPDVERMTLMLSATAQGIAALVGSLRITPEMGEQLLDDLVALVLVDGFAGRVDD